VSAFESGAKIDVRSASRYGLSDFGANAKRVVALLSDIEDAASNVPEPQEKAPEPKATPRRPAPRR
jgi:hypothetical protein